MSLGVHVAVLAGLLVEVRFPSPNDAAEPVPVEVVLQPVTATAPTHPVAEPPASPAPAGSPDTRQNATEQPVRQLVQQSPPPNPTQSPLRDDDTPSLPAVSGPQAELPPRAQPRAIPTVPTARKLVREPRRALSSDRPSPAPTRSRSRDSAADTAASARAELTAPATAPPEPAPAPVKATWRDQLAAWISAHKAYPETARERGEEGTCVLRFTVIHDGRVLEVEILHSSGHATLDAASVAILSGATVPPLPPEMPQMWQSVTVPLRYSLTRE